MRLTMGTRDEILCMMAEAYKKATKRGRAAYSTMLWKLPGTTGPMPPTGKEGCR